MAIQPSSPYQLKQTGWHNKNSSSWMWPGSVNLNFICYKIKSQKVKQCLKELWKWSFFVNVSFLLSPSVEEFSLIVLPLQWHNTWQDSGKSLFFFLFLFLFFLKIVFTHFQREGKGERKRGRETSICGCLLRAPTRDLACNPACAQTGNPTGDPLVRAGWHSIHWATPARVRLSFN